MRLDGTLAWSVRRELWENRSVYVAPLAAALIFLFGHLVSLIATGPPKQAAFVEPFTFATLVIMVVGVVVGIFYCLDAFYSERKDRSILFWKSLPVSDGTTVLSKAMVPLLVLPLFTTAVTIVVHVVMLLMSSAALLMRGLTITAPWQEVAPLAMAVELLYHIVIIHVLWYAPIFAWLLLSSAWARRAPFLWAGIPILAIAVVEKLVLGSTRFVDALTYRLVSGPMSAAGSERSNGPRDSGRLSGKSSFLDRAGRGCTVPRTCCAGEASQRTGLTSCSGPTIGICPIAMRRSSFDRSTSAQLPANHELQARPYVGDRTHIDVYEAERERNCADDVLRNVGRTGCLHQPPLGRTTSILTVRPRE